MAVSTTYAQTPSERICGWDIGFTLPGTVRLTDDANEIETFTVRLPNGGRFVPCAVWGYVAPLTQVPSLMQIFFDEYELETRSTNPLPAWVTERINDVYGPNEVLNIVVASDVPYFFNPETLLILIEEYDSSQLMPYRLVIYAPY
jgi:hypothetical protein